MQCDLLVDCPEKILGNLSPPICNHTYHYPEILDGAALVNGVALPQRVIDELRRLGIALSWYTAGELEDAVEACAVDEQLIDDNEGTNFHDKLKPLPHEYDHSNDIYGWYFKDKSHHNYYCPESDDGEKKPDDDDSPGQFF